MDTKAVLLVGVVLLALSLAARGGPAFTPMGESAAPAHPDADEATPAEPNGPAPTEPNEPACDDPNEPARPDTDAPAPSNSDETNDPAPADPNEPAGEQDYFKMSLEELMEVEVASAALMPAGSYVTAVAAAGSGESIPTGGPKGTSLKCGVAECGPPMLPCEQPCP